MSLRLNLAITKDVISQMYHYESVKATKVRRWST